jgi:hypothetical protein
VLLPDPPFWLSAAHTRIVNSASTFELDARVLALSHVILVSAL